MASGDRGVVKGCLYGNEDINIQAPDRVPSEQPGAVGEGSLAVLAAGRSKRVGELL